MLLKTIRSKAWQRYNNKCSATDPPYFHWSVGYRAGWSAHAKVAKESAKASTNTRFVTALEVFNDFKGNAPVANGGFMAWCYKKHKRLNAEGHSA